MNRSEQIQRRSGVVETDDDARPAHHCRPSGGVGQVVELQPLMMKKVKKPAEWGCSFPPGGLRIRHGGARYVGMGPSSYYEKLRVLSPRHDPDLPKPVAVGPRTSVLIVSELDAYLEKKAAQRVSNTVSKPAVLRRRDVRS